MKLELLSTLVLLSLAGQILAQDRFLVNIVEQVSSNDTRITFRCLGTIFTEKHILVPASCVTSGQVSAIYSIQVPTGAESGLGDPILENLPIGKITRHPDFEQERRSNNIAIIEAAEEFNSTFYTPRTLGEVGTNSSYTLLGLPNTLNNPSGAGVTVFRPEFCDDNFPQASCSVFPDRSEAACNVQLGGPLVSDNHRVVAGFLIDGVESCSIQNERFVLNYHAVNDFREWIDEVSAADITAKMSVFLILSAALLSIKNMI